MILYLEIFVGLNTFLILFYIFYTNFKIIKYFSKKFEKKDFWYLKIGTTLIFNYFNYFDNIVKNPKKLSFIKFKKDNELKIKLINKLIILLIINILILLII